MLVSSRRMINPALWKSETISALTMRQRLLFIGIFSNADDQGRMRAHPLLLRSTVFPFDDISPEDIEADLQAIVATGSVLLYSADDVDYLQVTGWWTYQTPKWAWPSEMPAPEGWQDRCRYRRGNETVKTNWDETATEDSPPEGDGDTKVESGRDQSETAPNSAPNDNTSDSDNASDSKAKTIMSANADYQIIRKSYLELFPDKPKPREKNDALTGKVKTRMNDTHFRENWKAALERASQSEFLHTGGFFDLGWFLKNDDHYIKCLNGNYDDRPGQGKASKEPYAGIKEWVAEQEAVI